MNAQGQLRETFTRGVSLAGDPAVAGLVAVTHHAGSWTNGTFYTHHNHRGDAVLTRSGTTTVGTYSYSAFGNLSSVLGPDVCRFKFSSKERDPSTGFYYYGYRYYAPTWQRWVNVDRLIVAGMFGPYHFVYGNPVTQIDPNGLDVWIVRMCDPNNYILGIINANHCWVVGENEDGSFWESDLMPGEGPLKPLNCPADIGFSEKSGWNPRNLPPNMTIIRHVVCSPAVDKKVREEAKRRAAEDKGRYDAIGYNCLAYANAICDYAIGAKLRELLEICRKCKNKREKCQ